MSDPTEMSRRVEITKINSKIQSDDKDEERIRLEAEHGQIWNTDELAADFTVEGFMAPYVVVVRKSDGQKGTMKFQHLPRFYFNLAVI